ncbi:hypothetical protein Tco_0439754 [Tanacetum coccineum]
MAPRGRPTRTTRARPVTATPPPVTDPTTTTSVTKCQTVSAMIVEGVSLLFWQHVLRPGKAMIAILREQVQEGMNAPFGMSNDVAYAMRGLDLKKEDDNLNIVSGGMKSKKGEAEFVEP